MGIEYAEDLLHLPLQILTSSIIIGILFIILVRLFANKH